MKLSSLTFALSVCGIVNIVSGHGVPSAEMFQAKSMEDFERLREMGGASVNEALKDEVYEHKRRHLATSQPLLAASFGGVPGFYHGVASGDPLPDAVIVWTRYTPTSATASITLELRMTPVLPSLALASHLDPNLNNQLRRANIVVSAASDWIAKVDVTGLPSGTDFIYAFSDGTRVSDVGQTKTAPSPTAAVAQMVYAVFSCAHFSNGYFHAYDVASTIKDLDFWVHVGDYFVRT
jgi:phosphodiesterase/alkaline phosphatase D-like protein